MSKNNIANRKMNLEFIYIILCAAACSEWSAAQYDYENDLRNEFIGLTPDLVALSETSNALYLIDRNLKAKFHLDALARWNFITNPSYENYLAAKKVASELCVFLRNITNNAESMVNHLVPFDNLGVAALPEMDYERLTGVVQNLTTTLENAQIPLSCCPGLENKYVKQEDVESIMASCRDAAFQSCVWNSWANGISGPTKRKFREYVTLMNAVAGLNDFPDASYFLLKQFQTNIMNDLYDMVHEIMPLYIELFAFVRFKLRQIYGSDIIARKGFIPVHLLGSLKSPNWGSLNKNLNPAVLPNSTSVVDRTTCWEIAKATDNYFASMGFPKLPNYFWSKSVIDVGPSDECVPSVWDMYGGPEDFRMIVCPMNTFDTAESIFKMIGRVHYMMQYQDQPMKYRRPPIQGFMNAVVNAISLSGITHTYESLLNAPCDAGVSFLLKSGLEIIAEIPFAFVIDTWRFGIMRKVVTAPQYNFKWWALREHYQGITFPGSFNKAGFDAGVNSEFLTGNLFIENVFEYIVTFQIFRHLCQMTKEYNPNRVGQKPLYKCQLGGRREIGALIRKVMRQGKSKRWKECLRMITGQSYLDPTPLLEYYQPLCRWLQGVNIANLQYHGWKPPKGAKLTSSSEALLNWKQLAYDLDYLV